MFYVTIKMLGDKETWTAFIKRVWGKEGEVAIAEGQALAVGRRNTENKFKDTVLESKF